MPKFKDHEFTVTNNSTTTVVDPITLEVIRRGIVSITDQIDANISRTAFSLYIYEYKDFAFGLVGADGELIAQRAQPARGFRGRGQISRRLGFSQALSNSGALRFAGDVRSDEVSALGCAW
jgi:ribose 1,5-bisphosphokinase PhnN